jgi:hypothetical protein
MNRAVIAIAFLAVSRAALAADVTFSGVSYNINRSGKFVEVVGRVVNNSNQPASLEITYGCDDKDGNLVDMYDFPLSLGGGETRPFKRGQVRYSPAITDCWVSARDF